MRSLRHSSRLGSLNRYSFTRFDYSFAPPRVGRAASRFFCQFLSTSPAVVLLGDPFASLCLWESRAIAIIINHGIYE